MSKKKKKGLPKRIAGLKIPKAVRKSEFGRFLGSKAGQALVAEAVLGAGAVALGLEAKDGLVGKTRRRGKAALDGSHRLVHALESAGAAFKAALHEPSADSPDLPGPTIAPQEAAPLPKKRESASPDDEFLTAH